MINWKKIAIYSLSFLMLAVLVFGYLAQRNVVQIYGGLTAVAAADRYPPTDEVVYIHNVHVLTPDGASFLPNRTVAIEEGFIRSIDTLASRSEAATHIDGTGKFLIPGLIDSHVHLFKSPNDLLLYVANGITEVREMIGEPAHLAWREEIQQGRVGPDLYIASPRLGSFGRLEGWLMKWTRGFDNIPDAATAERKVQQYAEAGYDAVKMYSHLNPVAYQALNRAARSAGLDVVGHIPWSLELADVLEAEQSEIAHLEELMNVFRREFGRFDTPAAANEFLDHVAARSREIAPELIAHGVSVTTTLWLTQSFVRQKFALDRVLREVELAYANPGITEWDPMLPRGLGWLPEVNRYRLPAELDAEQRAGQKLFWETYGRACAVILEHLAAAGVSIMAGTDANLPPAVPGFSLHDELMAMTRAGMSPAQVLRSATAIPAMWMGSRTGEIQPGYRANLLLLDANPLEDIANTRQINTVVLRGRPFDRRRLDGMLAAVRAANEASRTVGID